MDHQQRPGSVKHNRGAHVAGYPTRKGEKKAREKKARGKKAVMLPDSRLLKSKERYFRKQLINSSFSTKHTTEQPALTSKTLKDLSAKRTYAPGTHPTVTA